MIEKHILRRLVLEALNNTPQTQVVSIINDVERLVEKYNLFPSLEDCQRLNIKYRYYEAKTLHPIDQVKINEIIWDFSTERVITPGIDANNVNLPHLRLTKFGQDFISKSAPHYYDPQGYLESLRNIAQILDPVVEQYIYESVICFRRQLFFASAVMIGAAAENAILLLLQAITNSISDPQKKSEAEQLLDRPRLPAIFDTIMENLTPLTSANAIPYSVHQGCTEHLMSLFEMIRVQRNDAVHPVCGQIDRSKVFLALESFPTALQSVNKLIGWLANNSIP